MVQAEIKARYAGKAEEEWQRLEGSPIRRAEYLITRYCLEQFLPPCGWILDGGSGPGRYAVDLARQGYRVIMLDLLLEMLRFGQAKLAEAGEVDRVSPVNGDLINVPYPANTFDAVISLGAPLSHLTEAPLRAAAAAEMARVVKPGGLVFLTGLTRLACYRGAVFWLEQDPLFFQQITHPQFQQEGILLGKQRWYTFASGELEALAQSSGLEIIERVGCEGLANHLPLENLEKIAANPEHWEAWKTVLLSTCRDPSIIGISNHLLIIARKPEKVSPICSTI